MAAADLLATLQQFENATTAITDVVWLEATAHCRSPHPSVEAQRLGDFLEKNISNNKIRIRVTTLGQLLAAAGKTIPTPELKNRGELSIQSLLIELREDKAVLDAVVIFEDNWFMKNVASMPARFGLISTSAYLRIAEKLLLIPSAAAAEQAIRAVRPGVNLQDITKASTSVAKRRLPVSRRSRTG